MKTPLIGGAWESKEDYRDHIAALSVATVTASLLDGPYQTDFSKLGPVLNQALIPACVAHAWARLMKLWWFVTHGELVDFSPRFLDILSAEPDIPLEGGRRPRTVAKVSASIGCATTKTVPNDTSLLIAKYRDRAAITPAAMAEAAKYKIPGFLRAPLDRDGLRQYVRLFGAVSVLMQIGKEWYTAPNGLPSSADKDIDPLRPPARVIGGHQTLTKGFADPDFNTLLNEWGEGWGNHGEANYSVAAHQPFMLEGWTIAAIPARVKEFLANLPSPSAFHYEWDTNLAYGDDNEDVKFLQVALMISGFLPPIPAEQFGMYGPKTSTAVGKYQVSKGIYPVPGSCGPQTRRALNAQFSINN